MSDFEETFIINASKEGSVMRSVLMACVAMIALSWVPSAGADPANHGVSENSLSLSVLNAVPAVDVLSTGEITSVRGNATDRLVLNNSFVEIPYELQDVLQMLNSSGIVCISTGCTLGRYTLIDHD